MVGWFVLVESGLGAACTFGTLMGSGRLRFGLVLSGP